MLPPGSLELFHRHPLDDIVAKSPVEQLLGASLEGNGRTILNATA